MKYLIVGLLVLIIGLACFVAMDGCSTDTECMEMMGGDGSPE